ncbi:MAG: ribbon-helix-helix protein, CopG family [Deltaproteobacteria bacterium]|nr:ribbon-helix-helix protein, CopG family [Deltaproteobacteria bacterium]
MRTTIELPDEQRARLLEIAARRGEKGFSGIIQEALELYLRSQQQSSALEQALKSRGKFSEDEADALEQSARALRSRWR